MTEIPEEAAGGSTPSYESNYLWGGIGIVLTVVGAMKHNLCWLLWVAWLCFTFTIWSGTRKMVAQRWLVAGLEFILVCVVLFWLKTTLCPKLPLALTNQLATPNPSPAPARRQKPVAPTNNGIIQAMTDSPGGMQAGQDLTVNQSGAPKYAMTDTQQNAVRVEMERFAGSTVTIERVSADPDVIEHAARFEAALVGVNITAVPQSSIMTDQPSGLFFRYTDGSSPVAEGLAKALIDARLVQGKVGGIQDRGTRNLTVFISPQR
jgi:hypothetical protein